MNAVMTRLASLSLGLASALGLMAASQDAPKSPDLESRWKNRNLYSLTVKSLDGKPADLGQYKGKVTLVVNVASKCGYTPQYEKLEALYEKYKDKGFVVLGFPSNDFGAQEPGSSEEIRNFCTKNYKVTFPMFEKVQTKSGKGQSEVYEYLGTKSGKLPAWNFAKYLVAKDGTVISFYESKTAPDADDLVKAIEAALAK